MSGRFATVFIVFIVALTLFDAGFFVNGFDIRPRLPTCPEYTADYYFFDRRSPKEEDIPKPFVAPCQQGEDCQIVALQNFSMYIEGYNDRWCHHDYMNLRSYYNHEIQQWSIGEQMKGDKKQRFERPYYRYITQHPVVMDGEYKYMLQIFTDHLEFYGMSEPAVKISKGSSWRLHIRLKKFLSADDIKKAIVYEGYIFIDKERVFSIRALMTSNIVQTTDVDSSRPGKLKESSKPLPTTRLHTIISLRIFSKRLKPFVFLAYHFGDIPSLQTHSNVFRWKHNADAEQYYVYYRNMIMPVPKPNDLIFDFIKTKTTPAPPSAKSTIPPSTVTPKPVVPITRDSAKANEVDERDYTDEPTVETTVDEDYLITDELIYEDASYALMVPFVCIGIGMMVLLG
ncbi:unnamed protein product [Bursaphelenchus okinawaensis]|uniref:Uncharacterized protein n=1 Tax=Bursaphelenchus okinawaensis TaxID=465554 RepID=A0A811KFZ1_9BILA|nr:unnamed protein product [Bursaphelenchus okinawaensis]CAG9102106.1 unnamed protein product [Bursaphelenchus okinawaensis]